MTAAGARNISDDYAGTGIRFSVYLQGSEYVYAQWKGIGLKAVSSLSGKTKEAIYLFYKSKSEGVIDLWKEHIEKPLKYQYAYWYIADKHQLIIVFASGIADSFWSCDDYQNRLKALWKMEESCGMKLEKDIFEFRVSYMLKDLYYVGDGFVYEGMPSVEMALWSKKDFAFSVESYEMMDNMKTSYHIVNNTIIA